MHNEKICSVTIVLVLDNNSWSSMYQKDRMKNKAMPVKMLHWKKTNFKPKMLKRNWIIFQNIKLNLVKKINENLHICKYICAQMAIGDRFKKNIMLINERRIVEEKLFQKGRNRLYIFL